MINNKEMSEQDKRILRNRLKERRRFVNLTYQELADKTGLSKSTLQRYETGGIQNLPYDKIFVLSSALGVRPDYFTDLSRNYTNQSSLNDRGLSQTDRAKYVAELEKFEEAALSKISPSLIRRNYTLVLKNRGSIGNLVATKGPETWYMDFLQTGDSDLVSIDGETQYQQILMRFGRLVIYDKPISKYSIVVDKPFFDQQMLDRFNPVHLDVVVSIITLTDDGFDEFVFR